MLKQFKQISIQLTVEQSSRQRKYGLLEQSMRRHDTNTHDALTGLRLIGYLKRALPIELRIAQHEGTNIGITSLNIDLFEATVNEPFGRDKGNEVIKEVAALITEECGPKDTPYNGDDGQRFFILTHSVEDIYELIALAKRIRDRINSRAFILNLDGKQSTEVKVTLSMSIGMAIGQTAELPFDADMAAFHSPKVGRNKIVVHDPEGTHRQSFVPHVEDDYILFID